MLPRVDGVLKKPFRQQQEFFRQKLRLTSERWDDIRQAAHDRSFIVAGASRAALVNDFADVIQKTIDEGKSIQWWRENFGQIVNKHGWANWTGSDSPAGVAWRTKVIYQTNLRTSYAAGRWAQMTDPKVLKVLPWWIYRHHTVENPRQQHLRWNNLVLPAQHPWFATHYPPNGFGCACGVDAISDRQLKAMGKSGPDAVPDDGTYTFTDSKTGESWEIPNGVQAGWDYAPGAGVDAPLRQLVQDRLISYPPAIARALSEEISDYVSASDIPSRFADDVLSDTGAKGAGWLGYAQDYERISEAADTDLKGALVLLPAETVRAMGDTAVAEASEYRAIHADDYNYLTQALLDAETIESVKPERDGRAATLVTTTTIGSEVWIATWAAWSDKRRALTLQKLAIKRATKK